MSGDANAAQQFAPAGPANPVWPALPLEEWKDTYHTLHMWTQIVGKIRLALTPLQNHWWNTALYVNSSGLTTSPIPYHREMFEIQFDFIDHRLEIGTSYAASRAIALAPKAAFYAYTAPSPPGLGEQPLRPGAAFFDNQLGEFLLMYDDVRRANSPRDDILAFAESAYEAGANLAHWNRAALERSPAL